MFPCGVHQSCLALSSVRQILRSLLAYAHAVLRIVGCLFDYKLNFVPQIFPCGVHQSCLALSSARQILRSLLPYAHAVLRI
jgi:hypothetical protein